MKINMGFKWLLMIALLIGASNCKPKQNRGILSEQTHISVAAAANLRDVLEDLKQTYLRENPGRNLSLTFGSSGMLSQQIIHGAPFDVFLSADTLFPQKLQQAGKTISSNTVYAYGKIVMWSGRFDVSRGLDLVLDEKVKKIAIANPDLAPYGKVAVETLKQSHLFSRIESKIVWAENVNQAAQFASTGGADLGFISLSGALSGEMAKRGSYYELRGDESPGIPQSGVLIKGKNEAAARHFMAFITGQDMAGIWKKHGYAVE